MDRHPRLIPVRQLPDPDGVVLVLHGGAASSASPSVSQTQLSVVRMIPIARRIARVGRRRLAVYRLLNSSRGWDPARTPVDDARWALGQVHARYGDGVPVALVGHSLGGRAAILASTHPSVASVVALNPWVYPDDGEGDFGGAEFLIVHGDADRIADPGRSASVGRDIARTAPAGYVSVAGGTHAMLRRHGVFSTLAADFTSAVLLGSAPSDIVAGLRGGRHWLTM